MEQTPDGLLVHIRVSPDVVPLQGKALAHGDHFKETYLYQNGAFHFVGWDDPGPAGAYFVPI
jgi:hypothetical protein